MPIFYDMGSYYRFSKSNKEGRVMWKRLSALLCLCLLALLSAAAQSGVMTDTQATVSPNKLITINYLNPDGTINWQALEAASQELLKTALEAEASQAELQSRLKDLQTQYALLQNLSKEADESAKKLINDANIKINQLTAQLKITTGLSISLGIATTGFIVYEVGKVKKWW